MSGLDSNDRHPHFFISGQLVTYQELNALLNIDG